jgi:hypothetical protein
MQALADVSVEPEGSFVVVWNSDHLSEPYLRRTSVQGQQFDSDGNPIGGEFLISSASLDKQWSPSVSVDARGDFVVAWLGSDPTDTDDYASIQSRSFDGEGNSVGGQIQVNTYTTNNQVWPSIGTDFTGNFVIVWQSDGSLGSDDSSTSVQGRLFTQLLFADGFESGDTSAWSSTR